MRRPIGWNRGYPFNPGDLSVCITVANNYLEASPKVPWDDLRYIFGEIMYGEFCVVTPPFPRAPPLPAIAAMSAVPLCPPLSFLSVSYTHLTLPTKA